MKIVENFSLRFDIFCRLNSRPEKKTKKIFGSILVSALERTFSKSSMQRRTWIFSLFETPFFMQNFSTSFLQKLLVAKKFPVTCGARRFFLTTSKFDGFTGRSFWPKVAPNKMAKRINFIWKRRNFLSKWIEENRRTRKKLWFLVIRFHPKKERKNGEIERFFLYTCDRPNKTRRRKAKTVTTDATHRLEQISFPFSTKQSEKFDDGSRNRISADASISLCATNKNKINLF